MYYPFTDVTTFTCRLKSKKIHLPADCDLKVCRRGIHFAPSKKHCSFLIHENSIQDLCYFYFGKFLLVARLLPTYISISPYLQSHLLFLCKKTDVLYKDVLFLVIYLFPFDSEFFYLLNLLNFNLFLRTHIYVCVCVCVWWKALNMFLT